LNNQDQNSLPLSAVLITLNASSQLAAALKSLQFCADIVVLDSYSSDNTIEIATFHGARVVQHAWLGFGPQKHFAVALAKYDWVLCLDADEIISPELEQSIRIIMQQVSQGLLAKNTIGFDMSRCNYFLGRYLRHGEGYPDYSRRFFNRRFANWSNDPVHEKVESRLTNGCFMKLQGDLFHDSAENLEVYLNKQNRYTSIQAQSLAAQGKCPSVLKMTLSPIIRFIKFYLIRRGFLDGWPGLVHISIGCFNSFIKYAKTRELMKQNSNAQTDENRMN
jgi:glycosyltransferase involved in cell wall biosynthesis